MTKFFGAAAARLSGVAAMLLSWRPDEFWNATPAEFALALQLPAHGEGPDRATVEALRQQFPDDERR